MTESKSFNRVSTVVLTLLVILAMLPIILIVIASFSGEDALIRDGYTYFPAEWSLDSYYYMVKQGVMILRAYGVSFFVTFFGTALSVLLTTMLAYPMARKSFRGRNVLAFFVFFTMLFNGGIVPSYIMWTQIFGIKDTIWALIIPNYLVTAFNVILVKNYYQNSVPDSLIEAAGRSFRAQDLLPGDAPAVQANRGDHRAVHRNYLLERLDQRSVLYQQ